MEKHLTLVEEISAKVHHFHKLQQPFRIYHGSSCTTRPLAFDRKRVIDTSRLDRVLKIDTLSKRAVVEPNVSMLRLVQATLGYGLIPAVVMEFPQITVGGGFSGQSGESSSFKYGLFDETVFSIEIVLASGNIVRASKDENPDLIAGAARTYGTLGVVTLLELCLINAKAFVALTYYPVSSAKAAASKIKKETSNTSNDYVDGIIFSEDRGVVMAGRLTDTQTRDEVVRFSRPTDPWFYLHAEEVTAAGIKSKTVLIPVTDYLFRYDRGGFFWGPKCFEYFMIPRNRVTQRALDWYMNSQMMYRAMHGSKLADRFIAQDIAVPYSKMGSFVTAIEHLVKIYPLWLCPLREIPAEPGAMRLKAYKHLGKIEDTINVGIWGFGSNSPENFVRINRDIERIARVHRAEKCLYAHTYYTEEEFWQVYDREWYESLREKYEAKLLPTLYEKVIVDVQAQKQSFSGLWQIWPLRGVYGVAKATMKSEYVLISTDPILWILLGLLSCGMTLLAKAIWSAV